MFLSRAEHEVNFQGRFDPPQDLVDFTLDSFEAFLDLPAFATIAGMVDVDVDIHGTFSVGDDRRVSGVYAP